MTCQESVQLVRAIHPPKKRERAAFKRNGLPGLPGTPSLSQCTSLHLLAVQVDEAWTSQLTLGPLGWKAKLRKDLCRTFLAKTLRDVQTPSAPAYSLITGCPQCGSPVAHVQKRLNLVSLTEVLVQHAPTKRPAPPIARPAPVPRTSKGRPGVRNDGPWATLTD